MAVAAKRDNSPGSMAHKVGLRLATAEGIGSGRDLRVLDAFAGYGRLWSAVKRRYSGRLVVTSVDKRRSRGVITADNVRVLQGMDLTAFDIIDLDSYGVPADQAEVVGNSDYRGPIIWTCITVALGVLPMKVTTAEGIPPEWYRIAPIVVGGREVVDLRDRWCAYLARFGWLRHGVLSVSRTGSAALYGVSSRSELPISRASLDTATHGYTL